MKTHHLLFALVLNATVLMAQEQPVSGVDSTGVPGDNFSLQGALQLFKESESPEKFEEKLNKESQHVNNLDLNGDGDIDYIRVIDHVEGDVHAFVLQAIISEDEAQDVATIQLEKTGKEHAMLQIIGEEDLFGEEVIVEPLEESAESPGYEPVPDHRGPSASFEAEAGVVVNVWLWPSVRFVYASVYRPWVSPFRWRVYPTWWKPWRPLGWHVFHPFHVRHHRHFAVVHTHRTVRAHAVYRPHHRSSVTVTKRHSASIGNYKVTKTKRTTTGPRGNTVTKKTTTVKKNGNVKAKKTKVNRRKN
ncbi:MAG: hypothetical protein IPN29_09225 [Saprospiraceae bacterium]|nr:hypothetical protein [Saprospiraceae bacterium]